MDAFRARRELRSDAPEASRQKLRLLEAQKERIAALELDLLELRRSCDILSQELEPYYRIDKESSPPSAFERCPNEILLLIFEQYLNLDNGEKSQHVYIRRLLLVCQRWYKLVMNTPALWAYMEVWQADDLFDFDKKKSLIPYINTCIERSGNLPLAVTLHLGDFPTLSYYISERCYRSIEPFIDPQYQNYTSDKLFVINWELESPAYEAQLKQALACLFSKESSHYHRWHSLYLVLPDDDVLGENVLRRLAFATPNLVKLAAFNLPEALLGSDGDIYALPDASNVSWLQMQGQIHIAQFGFNFAHLQHLQISTDHEGRNLIALSQSHSLRYLDLYCFPMAEQRPTFDATATLISLPLLTEMRLRGRYDYLRPVTFDLPALERFNLVVHSLIPFPSGIIPRHLYMSIEPWCRNIVEMEDPTLLFQAILSLGSKLQRITVPDLGRDTLLRLVMQFRKEGHIPNLEEIVIETDTRQMALVDPRSESSIMQAMSDSVTSG